MREQKIAKDGGHSPCPVRIEGKFSGVRPARAGQPDGPRGRGFGTDRLVKRPTNLIVAQSMFSTTSHGITRNNPLAVMMISFHGCGGINVFLGMAYEFIHVIRSWSSRNKDRCCREAASFCYRASPGSDLTYNSLQNRTPNPRVPLTLRKHGTDLTMQPIGHHADDDSKLLPWNG